MGFRGGFGIGLGCLGFRVGLGIVSCWFRVDLFRVYFRESCWFKVTLRFLEGWLLGLGFKVGSSISGGLGRVSWWFRVGLGCFWAKREFRVGVGCIGARCLQRSRGVAGRSPPHLQKHWR